MLNEKNDDFIQLLILSIIIYEYKVKNNNIRVMTWTKRYN